MLKMRKKILWNRGRWKCDFRQDLTPLWRTLLKLRLPFVARKTNSEKKVSGGLNKDSLFSNRKVKIKFGKKIKRGLVIRKILDLIQDQSSQWFWFSQLYFQSSTRIGSADLISNCQNKSDPIRVNRGNEKLIAIFGFWFCN